MVVGLWGPYNEDDIGALPLSCPKYRQYSLPNFSILKTSCLPYVRPPLGIILGPDAIGTKDSLVSTYIETKD